MRSVEQIREVGKVIKAHFIDPSRSNLLTKEAGVTTVKLVIGVAIVSTGVGYAGRMAWDYFNEQKSASPIVVQPQVIRVLGAECNDVLVVVPEVIQPQRVIKPDVVIVPGSCGTTTP